MDLAKLAGWLAALAEVFAASLAAGATLVGPRYAEGCDASAAVAISTNLLLVADDEQNMLRLYNTRAGGRSIRQYDLSRFLGKEEADLEGAARIGDRAYWIGSHGRKKNGKAAPARQVIFATRLVGEGVDLQVIPVSQPYRQLLPDLAATPAMVEFDLPTASLKIPKQPGALNIESLCATAQGELWIGFRGPVPRGRALVVSLLNPAEVVEGGKARFGAPFQLDTGGLGIRDMAWAGGTWLILGGEWGKGTTYRLWQWAGPGKALEALVDEWPAGINPEAVVACPNSGRVQILCDEGTASAGIGPCKELKDPAAKSFGSLWVERSSPRGK